MKLWGIGRSATFLGRLRRDIAGNTLAIAGAALIPMLAMTGSAIDAARLYSVKVRLQQACDAGVLAGRKFMTDASGSTLDNNASTMATTFFTNNFKAGWFQTNTVSFTPAKTADNQVSGSASATVPLAVMGIFGFSAVPMTVTCQARYDVADTDVMFVLDVTGSMSCLPTDPATCGTTAVSYTRPDGSTDYYNPEKSGSKLQAVRDAVDSFYTTLASNSDATTHIRYGFVPYSSAVNVGKALYTLSPSYLVNKWYYQSRKLNATTPESAASTSTIYTSVNSSSSCNGYAAARSPASGYDSSGQATKKTVSYDSSGKKCTVTSYTYTPNWTYTQVGTVGNPAIDVSGYVATISNGGSVTDPSKVTGATSTWQGCVEERGMDPGKDDVSEYDINNLAPDLDPDLVPTSDHTRWRPMWPDLEYGRYNGDGASISNYSSTADYTSSGETTTNPGTGTYDFYTPRYSGNTSLKGGFYTCPPAVSPLATMTEAQVLTYVNALKAHGGTYHDIGMIWGTRMLSPNGIFSSYTQPWPGRGVPQRVIVFLTDGAMAPDLRAYSGYGIEYFDQRIMGNNTGTLADFHNARFLAECAKAKAEKMNVWVVAVGQSLTDPLTQCASKPAQAVYAGTSQDLSNTFKSIATAVAMLRISK